jgi:two-component system, response regulator PhcR
VSLPSLDANTVLYVDDEEQACKWFAKTFGSQFNIQTVVSAEIAANILRDESRHIAVVVCDHRMPHQTGMDFLSTLARTQPHIVRVLTSAYTDKTLLLDAISQSGVSYFIEKPWQDDAVYQVIRQSLRDYKHRALDQHAIKNGLLSAKSTLGFLAHELNTPLATVRGYLDMLAYGLKHQNLDNTSHTLRNQADRLFEPINVVNTLQQQVNYINDMLNASVQAAKMAMLQQELPQVMASELVRCVAQRFSVLAEFKSNIVIEQDFLLNEANDLIHLAVCSVVQNAIKAMEGLPNPELNIVVGRRKGKYLNSDYGTDFICISDNGAGIPIQVINNLNARKSSDSVNGAGMGLLFCKRVIESVSGEFIAESHLNDNHGLVSGVSTQITFLFNEYKKAN